MKLLLPRVHVFFRKLATEIVPHEIEQQKEFEQTSFEMLQTFENVEIPRIVGEITTSQSWVVRV